MTDPRNKLTGRHYGLADVRHASLQNTIGNRVMTRPVLAQDSGDANDIQTTNAIVYSIDGVIYNKAALSGQVVSVTDAVGDVLTQADDTTCYYVLALDSSGTVYTYKGEDGETTDLPGVPADRCVFGVVKVVLSSFGGAFTFGTDDFDASGVTSTFTDCAVQPSTAP